MLKYLVSTKETQGQRKSDFCFVPEGEPVKFGFDCDDKSIDGGCGCRRSMVGVRCRKGTTTMRVATLNMEKKELAAMFAKSLVTAGYLPVFGRLKLDRLAKEQAEEIVGIASQFPLDAIIERRGDKCQIRERTQV